MKKYKKMKEWAIIGNIQEKQHIIIILNNVINHKYVNFHKEVQHNNNPKVSTESSITNLSRSPDKILSFWGDKY